MKLPFFVTFNAIFLIKQRGGGSKVRKYACVLYEWPQVVSLDEERKQRQQLLLGGEICTLHSFMDKEIAIAFLSFIA